MKILVTVLLVSILSFLGFALAENSKRKENSSPTENHGQEKAHKHDEKGHEHGKEEAHEHGKEEAHEHGKEEAHEHGKEEAHEHGKEEAHEHGHEDGERNNVGPDKGVLEASEETGFKLRDGVEERFGIKAMILTSEKQILLPKEAIVYSKEEYQVFRKRDGFWKPIDVTIARKSSGVVVSSNDLKSRDEVAIEAVGFLKIVELSVFGPAIEGHIH
jgi:hypothetical protein